MKNLLLILLCLPLMFSCGEENNETEKTNTGNKEEVQIIDGIAYYENKIFKSSVEVIYYEDGELFTEVIWDKPGMNRHGIAYYNNKIFTGKEVQYDEDGKLFRETTFKDGKKDGLYRRWKGGNTITYSEGNYIDGKEDGAWKGWEVIYKDGFDDGKHNGRKDGVWEYYYEENGLQVMEENYIDGKEDGVFKRWYENGQLMYIKKYVNGELMSEECWDENGNEIYC